MAHSLHLRATYLQESERHHFSGGWGVESREFYRKSSDLLRAKAEAIRPAEVRTEGDAAGAIARAASDGYYEEYLKVCIDSRRSRLLWGSGNARQNCVDTGDRMGAGFLNPATTNVGVLENRWIRPEERSGSSMPSTGGDAKCAGLEAWTRGNCGRVHGGCGDGAVRISTASHLQTGFAALPQAGMECGRSEAKNIFGIGVDRPAIGFF